MEKIRKFFTIDKSLLSIEAADGTKLSLIQLAIPIFFEVTLRNLVNSANTWILSYSSETAAAAVATASQIQRLLMIFYTVISSGVTVIIAQYLGAGNRKRASEAATISVVFCFVMSLLIGLICSAFARPIMIMMNLEGELLEEAVKYFRIIASFNFTQTMITVYAAITRSYGKTRINFVIALMMNVLNAGLNAIVVFRPFETPFYGIEGVATTRIIAEAISLITNIILVNRAGIRFAWKSLLKPKFDLVWEIIKVGVPSGVGSMSYSISQTVSTAIMASTGMIALTTKSYVSSLVFFSYLISIALGQSSAVLIGQLVGKGEMDKAYRMEKQNVKLAVTANIIFSTCMWLASDLLLGTFHIENPEILELGKKVMFVDIFVEIGRAMNNVEENSLRASGDVLWQAVIAMTSCWAVSVFFSQVLGVWCGLGLIGCWMAFAMDEIGRGIAYMIRWESKRWMTKRLIKDEPAAAVESENTAETVEQN
ncbi:MAG: MATE family efflux transporter [Christensenellaceae bacterium]|nr:MATE family efflux transporter [Christensenellaceae bacterium]